MNIKIMTIISMIAALYTTLCMALAPLSFGAVQVRVSEALTLLPVFSVTGIWGVTLGCALSNLIGFFTGVNVLGLFDVFFGTIATLFAAILTRKARKIRLFGIPFLSAVPPVIINALIIGTELSVILSSGGNFCEVFVINFSYICIGQFFACFLLGIPFTMILEKTGVGKKCLEL